VNVPKTKLVKVISEERLVISITKGQEVYLGDDHVKLDELGPMLRQKIRDPRGQAVYVRADQDVAFGAFATVMSTVKAAGITNVSIVTEPMQVSKNK
jgi:biopolymer transport protein TolR